MSFGPLAFLNPWLLAALVTLPIIYWLLRAVPPRRAHRAVDVTASPTTEASMAAIDRSVGSSRTEEGRDGGDRPAAERANTVTLLASARLC